MPLPPESAPAFASATAFALEAEIHPPSQVVIGALQECAREHIHDHRDIATIVLDSLQDAGYVVMSVPDLVSAYDRWLVAIDR